MWFAQSGLLAPSDHSVKQTLISSMSKHIVILGGGLAGLSCGYELTKAGHRVTILEREPQVGGMATSFIEGDPDGDEYWSYDFGPHRFHSQDESLIQHVREIIGVENVVTAQRLSRIVLFNKFFDYPLQAKNVLKNMPKPLLVKSFLDYGWTRFLDVTRIKRHDERNFEGWVTKRFGKTLYRVFFGQYTEKTWGMHPSKISAVWASQRITLLNLWDTVKKTLKPPSTKDGPRTLVKEFIYPKYGGIGELARGYARKIEEQGGTVLTNAPAVRVFREGMKVTGVEYGKHDRQILTGDEYVNTIPVTALAKAARARSSRPRDLRSQLAAASVDRVRLPEAGSRVRQSRLVGLPAGEAPHRAPNLRVPQFQPPRCA